MPAATGTVPVKPGNSRGQGLKFKDSFDIMAQSLKRYFDILEEKGKVIREDKTTCMKVILMGIVAQCW